MVSSKTPVPHFWVEDWVEKEKASLWLRKPGQSFFLDIMKDLTSENNFQDSIRMRLLITR
jgi:hypothetical protein